MPRRHFVALVLRTCWRGAGSCHTLETDGTRLPYLYSTCNAEAKLSGAVRTTLRQRHWLSRQLKLTHAKAAMRSLVAVALTLAGVLASIRADADVGKKTKEQIEKLQVDAKNEDLMSAVRKNDLAMLERVLAAAEDPAEEILLIGGDLKNLLHYAAMWHPGKEAVVPKLIEAGAQLNGEDQFGYTPIMLSAMMGSASVMKLFIVSSQQLPSQPASRPAGRPAPSLPPSMCRLSRSMCVLS